MSLIEDVRHDLVERRLWPFAVGIAAAAVAVPVAFRPGDVTTFAPLPVTPVVPDQQSASLTALAPSAPTPQPGEVVATSLRDPFADVDAAGAPSGPSGPVTPTEPPAVVSQGVPAGPSGPGDAGAGDPGISPSASPSASTSGAAAPVKQTASSGVEETKKVGVGSEVPDVQPWKARLRVGVSTKARDVAAATPLPSADEPAFVLLGLLPKGRKAVLLLSDDVTASGQGTCRPRPTNCQTLELKPGQRARLTIAADGDTPARHLRVRYLRAVTGSPVRAKAAASRGRGAKRKLASRLSTGRAYWLNPALGTLGLTAPKHGFAARRAAARRAHAAGGKLPAKRRVAVGQAGTIGTTGASGVTGATGATGWTPPAS